MEKLWPIFPQCGKKFSTVWKNLDLPLRQGFEGQAAIHRTGAEKGCFGIASGGGNDFDNGMKSNPPQAVAKAPERRARGVVLLILFALAAAVVFHVLLVPGTVLLSSDDNVGLLKMNQRMLENSVAHPWMGEALWGMPTMSIVRPGYYLLKAVPAAVFMNGYHGFCLMLAAWLLALYLRDLGLRPAACVFGGLVAFWTGTNLTLTFAGHVGKYGTMVFLALAVFLLGRWGKTGRTAWAVAAGAAAGAMFLEQADVALFCALLLAPVGLFAAVRAAGGWKIAGLVKQAWAPALVAALLAGGASLAAKDSGVTESTDGQSAAERWAYITQWSQPPSESLDFIAPGWTGWRSGDDKGPYWGKMGRSEGYEQTRQGFMNFKLENVYVGAIPLLFALLGAAEALRRRKEPAAGLVVLWTGLWVLALLMAFGKFFILYKPLSLLPGFGSIRNPNKFIHFFQMAWGVVAAFGLDAALKLEARAAKKWLWGAGIAAGLFLLSGLALWSDLTAGAARLAAAGWGQYGQAIQWNKAFSVTYAGVALAVGAGILWLLKSLKPRFPAWGAWLPAAVVVFDAAFILAPHYIQTMPKGYVAENELVRYLKRETGLTSRTAMATKDGFYNFWLTYLFPYHGIPTIEVTQLPRPPADYSAFWQAVQDPVRMWKLAAVSHVLAHGQVAAQLLANPAWAAQLEPAWAYQPMDDGQGGVTVRSVPVNANAPEVVLKMKPAPARVAAVRSWRVVEDAEALKTLGSPTFEPYSSVLLAPGSQVCAPPAGDPGPAPEVKIEQNIPGRCEFTVANHGPVVMRVAEKFDPNWKATVDGQPAPVLRCDYMFQGVAIEPAGTHKVVLEYAPSSLPVWLQWAGILAGLGAAAVLLVPRRKEAAA